MIKMTLPDYLLGCPLCNNQCVVWCHEYGDCHPKYFYSIECENEEWCGCSTADFDTVEKAIAIWHRNEGSRIRLPMKTVNF
jgi:hypothetical protein